MHETLFELLLFTGAAAIFVPLFRYFNLGAILAYLFAGMLIGPHVLGLVKDPTVILHFSELGVVLLLFIIGLELAPKKLWRMRQAIFGLGLLQLLITGGIFFLIARAFGLAYGPAVIAGFGLALSSTAFAVQILEENHQLSTTHGQGSFSILMFQDLAVVPLMALVTLLAGASDKSIGIGEVAKVLIAILGIILVGRFIIRHVLRFVADSHTQEIFTSVSLFIVVGTAMLMESVGLSMGMGAFLAGVLLAESEYRHELETNLMPFKGLLLGLFFIAVGMTLRLPILLSKPFLILFITLGFVTLKGLIIFGLSRMFRYPADSSRNMAFTLPQGGEFAFVLFGAAFNQGLFDREVMAVLNASVTLSMAATPFLFSWNQKRRRSSELVERPYDKVDMEDPEVILAGYGRFGQIVSRLLIAEGIRHTILEHSASQVETARQFGIKIYYGDASNKEVLESAGAHKAQFFMVAIDDIDKSLATVKMAKKYFNHLTIIARARNRYHALELMENGVEHIHRETYLTSLQVAKEILVMKGRDPNIIDRKIALFCEHDDKILREQFHVRGDRKSFISYTNRATKELAEILKADLKP